MSEIIFIDKSTKPNSNTLAEVLGETINLWNEIKKYISDEYGEFIEEWKYYSKNSGWILKLLRKRRNLFFFIPYKDFFRIAFVFGDRAVSEVDKSDLPNDIKKSLLNARKYAEGRGIQLDIKTSEDIENVKKLLEIKIKN